MMYTLTLGNNTNNYITDDAFIIIEITTSTCTNIVLIAIPSMMNDSHQIYFTRMFKSTDHDLSTKQFH